MNYFWSDFIAKRINMKLSNTEPPLKKIDDISSINNTANYIELNKEIFLNNKIRIYVEPKKSIYYLNLKKNKKIVILGKKDIDGIEWSKVKTENGEEGWCILTKI